jgi:hypothetical protein
MWQRFQKVLPSDPGWNGGGLVSTGASQSPPRIVPESSESARDVIASRQLAALADSDRVLLSRSPCAPGTLLKPAHFFGA